MSSFTKPLKYKKLDQKFKGRNLYEITESFEYKLGSLQNPIGVIEVPSGFITDFASIPVPLYYLFNPEDSKIAKAAVLHDYLIKRTRAGDYKTFSIANSIFYEALLVSGANIFETYLFHSAVCLFGFIRPFIKSKQLPLKV